MINAGLDQGPQLGDDLVARRGILNPPEVGFHVEQRVRNDNGVNGKGNRALGQLGRLCRNHNDAIACVDRLQLADESLQLLGSTAQMLILWILDQLQHELRVRSLQRLSRGAVQSTTDYV